MLTILTFNAALLDIRIFNQSVYCPVDTVHKRLPRLASALLSLKPDIISLQEVFHYDLQRQLYNQLAKDFPYVMGYTKSGLKLRLGNELLTLSRFPISHGKMVRFDRAAPEEKLFTSKGFYHSCVLIPELGEIDLINFHTTAGGVHAHPEHDRMEKIRSNQIDQILTYIQKLDKVVLAGDLNAGPHISKQNYQHILESGFIDTFAAADGKGFSWDPDNPLVAKGKERHLPAQKIDHILINDSLSRLIMPVESTIVLADYNKDSMSNETPLSDHYGVMTKFKKSI